MKSYRFTWRARFVKFLLARVWPKILWFAQPLLWVKRRVRPQKVALESVSGQARGNGGSIRVLNGVTAQTRHHLFHLLFEDPATIQGQDLGIQNLLKAFRAPATIAPAADLALVPANQGQVSWLNDGGWFPISLLVRGHVPLPLDPAIFSDDSVRSNRRLTRKHGYEYIVTRDEKLFDEFYTRMLEPYARLNYGEGAVMGTLEEKRGDRGEYDLMLLQKQSEPGKYLAGFLIIYEPDAARLWSLGVRDGDYNLVREGVLASLYNFAFEYFTGKGFKLVNMGGCRPFLKDGVLRFKRRYRQELTSWHWDGYGLRILQLTPAVRAFLLNNPFIFHSHGKLYGAVFAEAPLDAKAIRELHASYANRGMQRIFIWVFRNEAATPLPALPSELAGAVELRPAEELISGNLHLP